MEKPKKLKMPDLCFQRDRFSDKSGYLVFSGTSERKRDVTLSLYLDDSTKSFAKVKLTRQNRKNAWSTDDNRCIKISDEIKENIKYILNLRIIMEMNIKARV